MIAPRPFDSPRDFDAGAEGIPTSSASCERCLPDFTATVPTDGIALS